MRTYEPLALLGFIIAGIIAGIIDRKNLETMRNGIWREKMAKKRKPTFTS